MAFAFRKLAAGAAVLALLAGGQPAAAADGAAIKKDLDAIVAGLKRLAGPGPSFQVQGEVTVRQQDGDTVATLPTFVSRGPEGTFVLRPVTLRIKDVDADVQQIELQVPPRIELTGPDGKPFFALAFGGQSLVGTWRKSIQNFEALQMTLERVTLLDPTQKPVAEIDRIALTGGVKEGQPGLWSGTFRISVDGTRVASPDGSTVAIGSTFYEYTLKDARLAEIARIADQAGFSIANPSLMLSGPSLSMPQWQALVDAIAQLPALIGGMSVLYGVQDIAVASPMMGPQPLLRAESVAFGFGVANDGAGGASLSLGIDLKRVRGPNELPIEIPPSALPHSFDLRIEVDQLPTGIVWETFFGGVRQQMALAQQPRQGQRPPPPEAVIESAFGAAFGMSLPLAMETFAKARPQVHLRGLSLSFPEARIDTVGTVRFTPEAPQLVSGAFDVKLAGLDDLIEKLGRAPKSDEEATAVVALTFLRGLGKPTPGPGGKPIYVIQVQIAEDGRILANGIDAMKIVELLEKRR
ncbi:MAG: hypothetical protein IT561_15695 [Alphaproteobacteria bacterium]|nr:hypothetical protein [Alphaproteobacteria bacterium]